MTTSFTFKRREHDCRQKNTSDKDTIKKIKQNQICLISSRAGKAQEIQADLETKTKKAKKSSRTEAAPVVLWSTGNKRNNQTNDSVEVPRQCDN